MFEMIIKGDEHKLVNEGKYNLSEFNELLRSICLDTCFMEVSPGHYLLDDKYDEIGRMFVLEAKFRKAGDIIPNLAVWTTYSDEEGEVNELQ